jgi:hypothetical protein
MPRLLPLLAGAGIALATGPAAADRCADGVAAAADDRADPILGLLDLATPTTTPSPTAASRSAPRRLAPRASRSSPPIACRSRSIGSPIGRSPRR